MYNVLCWGHWVETWHYWGFLLQRGGLDDFKLQGGHLYMWSVITPMFWKQRGVWHRRGFPAMYISKKPYWCLYYELGRCEGLLLALWFSTFHWIYLLAAYLIYEMLPKTIYISRKCCWNTYNFESLRRRNIHSQVRLNSFVFLIVYFKDRTAEYNRNVVSYVCNWVNIDSLAADMKMMISQYIPWPSTITFKWRK